MNRFWRRAAASISRVCQNSMVRGATLLASATAVAQIILLSATPILSRLYSPSEFAVLSVVSSAGLVLALALTLRYESAVALAEEDDEARGLVVAAMFLATVGATIVAASVFLFQDDLLRIANQGFLGGWVLAIPGIALALAAVRAAQQWNIREKKYKQISYRHVTNAGIASSTQVGLGLIAAGPGGLVLGYAAGQIAAVFLLLRKSGLARRYDLIKIRNSMARYRKFSFQLTVAGVLSTIGLYVPLFMITGLFGPESGGHFGMTQRILLLPVALLGQSLAQVFLGEVASRRRNNSAPPIKLFYKSTKFLFVAGAVIAGSLLIAGPWIFTLALGENWALAGEMSRPMALVLLTQIVASPLVQVMIVYERTLAKLIWDVSRLVLVILAIFVVFYAGGGVMTCLWAYATTNAVMYVVSWELSRRTVRGR